MTTNKHAALSPSGSSKWIGCPGSALMEKGITEDPSPYAAEGTAAHFLAEWGFEKCNGKLPEALIGKKILVTEEDTMWHEGLAGVLKGDGENTFVIEVTEDMLTKIQKYIDIINHCVKEVDGELLIENRVSIEHITGEKGAEGSADAIILSPGLMQVHDLKYGHNPVEVNDNSQLILYVLGALEEFGDMMTFENVRMGIHMPNLHTHEVTEISVEKLREWGESLKVSAELSLDILEGRQELDVEAHILPGDHCKKGFCKARATCKKLHDETVEMCDFEALPASPEELNSISLERMGYILSKQKQAIDWFGAIETRVKTLMKAGTKVPYHKLVMGKEGNREWDDPKEVEQILRKMKGIKLEEVYDSKLISPTTAGKLAGKGTIGPRQWKTLGDHITRKPGKPKVVRESDPGEEIEASNPADDFDNLDEEKKEQ